MSTTWEPSRGLPEVSEAVLIALAEKTSEAPRVTIKGPELQQATSLTTVQINDAMTVLRDSGYVAWILYLETVDYVFSEAWITAKGRFEADRLKKLLFQKYEGAKSSFSKFKVYANRELITSPLTVQGDGGISLQPVPAGSPFGFTDRDWEHIAERKGQSDTLFVVLGLQFESSHYKTDLLVANIEEMFERAVADYVSRPGSWPTKLKFKMLGAGYGEHLFNQIARDIISADIAVFETSDLNPNVMIELGVALTWDVRVLPVRENSQPVPPSDISGQTWAAYLDSASRFTDPHHHEKLVRMVERAMLKKAHR